MRKHLAALAIGTLVVTLWTSAAAAQTFTAQVSGRVLDDTGAVLPGVSVTAANEETGARRTATTDGEGTYVLASLTPGRYTITAELQGLATMTRNGVVLTVNQGARFDIQMKIAGVTETVEVTMEAPLVETTKSEVGLTVTPRQVENLPLNGRNFLELALLAPGVKVPLERTSTDVSFGAGSGRSSYIQVDGADNNDDTVGGAESTFSMDSIREFQVVTNRFSAEFGRSSSGVVNIVTKSGTNALHGGGFGYFRDDALKAKNWFTGRTEPFSRKQFGGSIGGPILKNRTHFFGTVERQANAETAVPNTGSSQLDKPLDVANNVTIGFIKVDHQVTDGHHIFGSYSATLSDARNSDIGGSATFEYGTIRRRQTHSATLGLTSVFSQRAVNDIRVLYRNHDTAGDPNVSKVGLLFPSANLGTRSNYPQKRGEQRVQFRDDFGYFPKWHGQHALKVGLDVSQISYSVLLANATYGQFTFTSNPTDFLNPATYPPPSRYQQGLGRSDTSGTTHSYNVYAQDDWQVAQRLTLNLGLRYEIEPGAANNDFETTRSDLVRKKKTDADNVSHRLGAVYDVFGNGHTVLRGGSGVFYDQFILNMSFNEKLFNGEAFVLADIRPQAGAPISLTDPLSGRGFEDFLRTASATSVQRLDPKIEVPYAYQSSIGIQQRLGVAAAVSIDYVRINGHNEIVQRDSNLDPQCSNVRAGCKRPNPRFGAVLESASIGESVYNGLHTSLTIRFRRHTLQTSYTLSKGMNEVDDPARGSALSNQFDPHADWGPSANDRRHTLVMNGSYELPYGFQVSGIFNGGSSFVILGTRVSEDLNGDGVVNDRPAGIGRNSYRSDPTAKFDMRLTKVFQVGRARITGIAEVFNVSNRENHDPGAYGNRIGTATFLKPGTSTVTYFQAREAQLALRVAF